MFFCQFSSEIQIFRWLSKILVSWMPGWSTTSQARVLSRLRRGKTLVTAGHVTPENPQNLGGGGNSTEGGVAEERTEIY